MALRLLSPFSNTRREELIRLAREEFFINISAKDPLIRLLEFTDYVISYKVAYVAVMLVIISVIANVGILYVVIAIVVNMKW